MKQTVEDKQNKLALKILKHDSTEGFNACLVTQEERATKKWDRKSREWWLLRAFVVNARYWCGWDVSYGHDIVVDMLTQRSYTGVHGVFTDNFVFISDYYGFSEGAFYYRKTT